MSTLSGMPTYLGKQLEFFFPDGNAPSLEELQKIHDLASQRLRVCFSEINNKYFQGDFEKVFTPLHGDHYAMYLYLAARVAYENLANETLASKCFLLNKALHGIDAFYRVKLPEIFLFVHPLGTVLGNADYHNYFCVFQGCTVGSKDYGIYPKFSGPTIMYANTSIIGDCQVGKHTVLASGTMLIGGKLQDQTTIMGRHPDFKRTPTNPLYFNEIFHHAH